MSAIVGLLTPQQLLFADEFSQVLVQESSNDDQINSSDDGQGLVLDRAKEKAIVKMIKSKEMTNQRLIDMMRVKYAHQKGIKIRFNRFNLSDDEKINEVRDTFVLAANDQRKVDLSLEMDRSQSKLLVD